MLIFKRGKENHNLKIILALIRVNQNYLYKPQVGHIIRRLKTHGIAEAIKLMQYHVRINQEGKGWLNDKYS